MAEPPEGERRGGHHTGVGRSKGGLPAGEDQALCLLVGRELGQPFRDLGLTPWPPPQGAGVVTSVFGT